MDGHLDFFLLMRLDAFLLMRGHLLLVLHQNIDYECPKLIREEAEKHPQNRIVPQNAKKITSRQQRI